jgi:extradiol dioxygenase family protein
MCGELLGEQVEVGRGRGVQRGQLAAQPVDLDVFGAQLVQHRPQLGETLSQEREDDVALAHVVPFQAAAERVAPRAEVVVR